MANESDKTIFKSIELDTSHTSYMSLSSSILAKHELLELLELPTVALAIA